MSILHVDEDAAQELDDYFAMRRMMRMQDKEISENEAQDRRCQTLVAIAVVIIVGVLIAVISS